MKRKIFLTIALGLLLYSSSLADEREQSTAGIKKLTVLISVKVEEPDHAYKNKPRYIAGIKEMKELAKKISQDNQIKDKILDETAKTLEAWNKQITEEYTALVDVTLEPYTALGIGGGDIIFKINPSVLVRMAKGRHGIKSFKNMMVKGKTDTAGGVSTGTLYDSTEYDKIVYKCVQKASAIALYFSKKGRLENY